MCRPFGADYDCDEMMLSWPRLTIHEESVIVSTGSTVTGSHMKNLTIIWQ
jgi:hypothetical protein